MPDALEEYLEEIGSLVGFKGGPEGDDAVVESLEKFVEWGRAGQSVAFAFRTMKIAWGAMPPDIRDMVRAKLEDAATEALDKFGDSIETVPIIGQIAGLVIEMFRIVGEMKRGNEGNNTAASLQERNRAQRATFLRAEHPTDWVWARVNGELYMRWGGGSGDNRWRERPALSPVTKEARVVGFPDGNPSSGNCYPGKPFRSFMGKWYQKDESPRCSYTTQFSALYYPFWSPVDDVGPVPFYGIEIWPPEAGFKDPGVDPNETLIKRQSLLIGDPITNLQVSGDEVGRRHDRFLLWFKYARHWRIDDAYIEERDYEKSPLAYLYYDDNGLIRIYARVAREGNFAMEDVIATGVEQKDGVNVTPAMYNCIVGMTRAFFTARAAFLGNSIAMGAYLKDGTAETFDPRVWEAVKEAGKPKRIKKQVERIAAARQAEGGGGVLLLGGAAVAGLLAYLKWGRG